MVVLFYEIKQRAGYGRVVGDEPVIEVGKAEEGMYFLDFGRGRPHNNTVQFDRVHGELSRFYNHAEVFNFRDIELTFL